MNDAVKRKIVGQRWKTLEREGISRPRDEKENAERAKASRRDSRGVDARP